MTRFTVLTANLDAKRPGSRKYRKYLRTTYKPDAMLLQEVGGLGRRSTRVAGKGVRDRRRVEVGSTGAHRWTATGTLQLPDAAINLLSSHALHVGTVGRTAQDDYYSALRRVHVPAFRPTVWGLDGNREHTAVAKLLGAKSVGRGVDGLLYGPGLRLLIVRRDRHGIDQGWTNHPAIVATFEVTE